MPRIYLAIEFEKAIKDERLRYQEVAALLEVINLQARAKDWRLVRQQHGVKKGKQQKAG